MLKRHQQPNFWVIWEENAYRVFWSGPKYKGGIPGPRAACVPASTVLKARGIRCGHARLVKHSSVMGPSSPHWASYFTGPLSIVLIIHGREGEKKRWRVWSYYWKTKKMWLVGFKNNET